MKAHAYAAIMGRVRARRAKWKTEIVDMLPPPESYGESVIVGTFSHCTLTSRRRLLLGPLCVSTDEGPETPSTLARDYLFSTYGRSPRVMHEQVEVIRASMPPMPLLAQPCTFARGWYIDIVSAYWSVLQVVGWNIDYWPGRWLGPGRAPSDFPWPRHKVARNCLVSAGLPAKTTIYVPDKGYQSVTTGNPLANLQLYRLLADTLTSIAAEMKAAGVVYVNTDGYIVRTIAQLQSAVSTLARWGLTAGIKLHGPGWVKGPGAYAIGHNISRRRMRRARAFDNIRPPAYAEWLRENFSRHAANARKEGLFDDIDLQVTAPPPPEPKGTLPRTGGRKA